METKVLNALGVLYALQLAKKHSVPVGKVIDILNEFIAYTNNN